MSLLSVLSPKGSRALPLCLSLAALLAASCAQGDPVGSSSGADASAGGGDATGGGGRPGSGSGGGDPTASSTITGPGSTTTSNTTGAGGETTSGPGGGEGAGTSDGGSGPGAGGSDGGAGGGGGEGGAAPVCGDDTLNNDEDCDGDDLGPATCVSIGQGFIGGDLACDGACAFDVSGCTAPPDCGNGVIEGTEECDGADLDGATCESRNFDSGTLACTGGCAFDESDCQTCGDGEVSGSEVCDGANLGAGSCTGLGHDGGTLSCAANCFSFVQDACSDCGDGIVESPEVCDSSMFPGQSCTSNGYEGGSLTCNGTCGGVTFGNCWICGDGIAHPNQNCPIACDDDGDNDNDGYRDLADIGCTNTADTNEQLYLDNCPGGTTGPIYDISYANTSTDFSVDYSNVGFPDNTDAPCQSNTGAEVQFVMRAAVAESDIIFRTDVGTTNFDTVLTVRRGSCTATSGAVCDDDGGLGNYSFLQVFNVTQGELLFITIEGWNGETGNFTLGVDLESND